MEPATAPLLSVVIPVYNGEQYVPSMIQCFRDQAAQNFELIFVDDGSTDQTKALLHSYARSESFPMTVVELEPLGVSAARNAGMERVRGKYLSFVDVDDRIVPEYTSVLEQALSEDDGFDLFFFTSERVTPVGPFDGLEKYSGSTGYTKLEMLERIGSDPTRFGVYNMFQRSSFVEEHGFRFTEGYDYYEDYDYLFRVVAQTDKVRMTEDRLYYYLIQEGSAVATFGLSRVSCVELLEGLIPYLARYAPDFGPMYVDYVLPRIWWSVMWQACLAFSPMDALRFGRAADMKQKMKRLSTCKDPKVADSAKLYLAAPPAFVAAASVAGRTRSKIERTDVEPFLDYFNAKRQ